MRRNTDKEFQKQANKYAKGSIESMRDDLDALEHARECDGTEDNGKECKRGQETRRVKLKDGRTVQQCKHENPEVWHNEDAARRVIEEAPLSIEVRGGWYTPGDEEKGGEPEEYQILLGTGGPASRIVGELSGGQPTTAVFEYQDWFKPWTAAEITSEEEATLLEWAQTFYFGE